MHSFLLERRQHVKINNITSRGVPVGRFPPVTVYIVHKYRPVPMRYRYFYVSQLGPYPRPVAVLVYKCDVPRHLYYSGSNISTKKTLLVFRAVVVVNYQVATVADLPRLYAVVASFEAVYPPTAAGRSR